LRQEATGARFSPFGEQLGGFGERVAQQTCSLSYADWLKTDSIVATEIRNMATGKENTMARTFQFDVEAVVKQLNRILQMELAAVIYYTHYSFMIYGHARIPITSWLRDNASESLAQFRSLRPTLTLRAACHDAGAWRRIIEAISQVTDFIKNNSSIGELACAASSRVVRGSQ
jgi:hypothetical protein